MRCLADYRHMLDALGVERAVLVQPSVYGTDNRAMLDALDADPARLRGVAVVDFDVDAKSIEAHACARRARRALQHRRPEGRPGACCRSPR